MTSSQLTILLVLQSSLWAVIVIAVVLAFVAVGRRWISHIADELSALRAEMVQLRWQIAKMSIISAGNIPGGDDLALFYATELSYEMHDRGATSGDVELALGQALRQALSGRYNDSELRDLVADLGVDYDSLPGATKGDKARELVQLFVRQEKLFELAEHVMQARLDLRRDAKLEQVLRGIKGHKG